MYGHLAEGSRRAAHGEITAGNGVLPSHWQFAERSFRPAERVRPAVRVTEGVGQFGGEVRLPQRRGARGMKGPASEEAGYNKYPTLLNSEG